MREVRIDLKIELKGGSKLAIGGGESLGANLEKRA